MGDKKKIPLPIAVQNLVKAVYLTGYSLILSAVFLIFGFFFYGHVYSEPFPIYMVSQIIVLWVFFNGNIKINCDW